MTYREAVRRLLPPPVVSLTAPLALLACLLAGAVVAVDRAPSPVGSALTAAAASDRQIHLARLDTAGRPWKSAGTRAGQQLSRWKSPWVTPGFDFTELIASWSARASGSAKTIRPWAGRSSEPSAASTLT